MSAYIITNSELVAIANAIRNKNSSNETFTLEQIPNAIATIGESIGSGAVIKNANDDKYIVNDIKLINIANAIRNKLNISDKITIANMPNLINNIQTNYTINYYNGNVLLKSDEVTAGTDAIYSGTTPTKIQDAQYTYSFAGWSKGSDDNTVDSDALTNVTADRNVYACFTSTLRKYTVTFVRSSTDGGGTLQTINNVNYGTVITAASSYTGAMPTTTQGDATDYPFEGWEPASATVTGNTTFTAKFDSPVDVSEITDSWDTIIANIDNGTYKTAYKIGQYKSLPITGATTPIMQIVGFDIDTDAKGDTIPISFVSMGRVGVTYFHSADVTSDYLLSDTIKPYVDGLLNNINDTAVKSRIIAANKTYKSASETKSMMAKLWIPSVRELAGNESVSYRESSGPIYDKVYAKQSDRIKYYDTEVLYYWTRTADVQTRARVVYPNGTMNKERFNNYSSVVIGFCLGLEPETITDSWETILANENPSASYSIGDTKSITINNEPHLMQIVGFDTDDKTSGGKAKISWLMKDLLTTTHRMNATNTNANGWPATEMRTWLRNTILPTIDSSIRSHIVDVDKTYYDSTDQTTKTSSDNIWLASAREMFGGTSYESSGPDYTTLFTDRTNTIKKRSGTVLYWWLRSAHSNKAGYFRWVHATGGISGYGANNDGGVCLGFCTD